MNILTEIRDAREPWELYDFNGDGISVKYKGGSISNLILRTPASLESAALSDKKMLMVEIYDTKKLTVRCGWNLLFPGEEVYETSIKNVFNGVSSLTPNMFKNKKEEILNNCNNI